MIQLYQFYYSDWCKPQLLPGCIHRKNINPDRGLWGETADILSVYDNDQWPSADYVGFCSYKLLELTGLKFEDIRKQITDSPAYIMTSDYFKPFKHVFDKSSIPGLLESCDIIDNAGILPFKLRHFNVKKLKCFGNYWLINPELFKQYIETCLLPVIQYFQMTDTPEVNQSKERTFEYRGKQVKELSCFSEGLFGCWLIYNKIPFTYIRKDNLDPLSKLAIKYGTDKYSSHTYTPIYDKYFKELKNKKIHLFEIGVGGHNYDTNSYDDPNIGGESLRMWKEYFPKGKITSLDIFDKLNIAEDRITIFISNQTDEDYLKLIIEKRGTPDIIIDDGGHIKTDVVRSFEILFPLLASDGIYVIEDTQTSYLPGFGEGSSMDYFKMRADGLNYKEIPGYQPNYYDMNIISVHFYHNLIFIFKGENLEESNI